MRKKILFYSHQSNIAGAPLSLANLASNLSSAYEAVFVTPADVPVLKAVSCKKIVIGSFFQISKLKRIIKAEHIDIVHANTILAAPAARAAHSTNTKLIWHIREDLQMFNNRLLKNIKNYAQRVIIISDSMKKYFKDIPQTIRIYNGIAEQNIKKTAQHSVPTILFAGTIEPRKGVLDLVKAAAIIRNTYGNSFKLNIYGHPLPTTKNYYKKIMSYIKQQSLEKIVQFKGIEPSLNNAMIKADLVAIPSHAEPFGRVAVEAMMLKKPVIASHCGGLAEIIIDKQTGYLFKTGDYTMLASKIIKLFKNKKIAQRMGAAGYKRYLKEFTLKKHVAAIEQVYKDLLR